MASFSAAALAVSASNCSGVVDEVRLACRANACETKLAVSLDREPGS